MSEIPEIYEVGAVLYHAGVDCRGGLTDDALGVRYTVLEQIHCPNDAVYYRVLVQSPLGYYTTVANLNVGTMRLSRTPPKKMVLLDSLGLSPNMTIEVLRKMGSIHSLKYKYKTGEIKIKPRQKLES
jgi:hypothetical protein